MTVQIEEEKLNIIKECIKANPKFEGNEDLFDDFVEETSKKAFLIVKSIKNEDSLRTYLDKIITTVIIQKVKDLGRKKTSTPKRTISREEKEPITDIKQEEIEIETEIEVEAEEIEPAKETKPVNKYAKVDVNYNIIDIDDNDDDDEIVIKKEVLQKLNDSIAIANTTYPEKQYLKLFELRYKKNLKQKDIAKELNITQSEVSERLIGLMEEVKTVFNDG